jgi:hypothetical protein
VAADAVGVERRGRPHVVWLPQWVAAAATGEEEEVARRRWFEFVRESPCERMGQRVAEVGTGYGKASDGRRPGGQEARTRVAVAGSARGRQEVSVYTGHTTQPHMFKIRPRAYAWTDANLTIYE